MRARPDVHHHLLPLIIVSKEGIMKDFLKEKTAEVSKQVWPDETVRYAALLPILPIELSDANPLPNMNHHHHWHPYRHMPISL